MEGDEFPHQREPDTGAFVGPSGGAFDPMKALEHAVEVLRCDAGAGIAHPQDSAVAFAGGRHLNFARQKELKA